MDVADLQLRLRTLSRPALIAFAARCARRVAPLYQRHKPDDLRVARAIDVAESEAVAGGWLGASADDVVRDASAALEGTDDAYAVLAARAAVIAACVVAEMNGIPAVASVAADISEVVGPVPINADLTLLETVASQGGWTAQSSVPPRAFGPLWPEGPPNWARESDKHVRDEGSPWNAEIIALTPWAKLVLATRCAKRVLPLFELASPHDRRPRVALEAAEAALESSVPHDELVAAAGRAATDALAAVSELTENTPSANAARAAANAAASAAHAVNEAATSGAISAFNWSVRAVASRDSRNVKALQVDDLKRLESASEGTWKQIPPVPQDFVGPLWPNGVPEWGQGESASNEAIPITDEEIALLPLWARVAFAARCAYRVLPLLDGARKAEARQLVLDAVFLAQHPDHELLDPSVDPNNLVGLGHGDSAVAVGVKIVAA